MSEEREAEQGDQEQKDKGPDAAQELRNQRLQSTNLDRDKSVPPHSACQGAIPKMWAARGPDSAETPIEEAIDRSLYFSPSLPFGQARSVVLSCSR